jgi:imidazolonepropionase-like amidohydrolase
MMNDNRMTLVLTNATIVDPISKTLVPNCSVVVKNERIAYVGKSGGAVYESGATVVDCKNKFLLAGLVDAHVHLQATNYRGPTQEKPVPELIAKRDKEGIISKLHSYLYCGVTSVYDSGNDADTIYELRGEERAKKIQSPRIFCTGHIVTCTGGHGSPMIAAIDSMPGDQSKLDAYLSREPDFVKVTYDEHNWGIRPLIPVLDKETLRAIIAYCHSKKIRVTSHISNETRAREAIDCGVDSLAHPIIQSPVTPEFIWLLSEKRIPMATTLAIGERYSRLADHPEFLDEPLFASCFTVEERHNLKTEESEKQRKNRWAQWMKIMTPVAQENLRQMQEAGVIIAAGTDLSSGPDYHRELELLQAGGIAPFDIIVDASYNAALYLNKEKELGSIEPGKLADMILVDEDPTKDINNLKKISLVVKNGDVVDMSKLNLPINKKNLVPASGSLA